MKKAKQVSLWRKLRLVIDSLSLRERRLLAIVSSVVTFTILINVLWLPTYKRYIKIEGENNDYANQISASIESIELLKVQAKQDVNQPYKKKLANLENTLNRQDEELAKLTAILIKPENMNQVFRELLSESKLKVIKLNNYPAVRIKDKDIKENKHSLFQHFLNIELKGDYLSLLSFIQNIESQKWQLHWNNIEFEIEDYPYGKAIINVHTLSTSKKVLEL